MSAGFDFTSIFQTYLGFQIIPDGLDIVAKKKKKKVINYWQF